MNKWEMECERLSNIIEEYKKIERKLKSQLKSKSIKNHPDYKELKKELKLTNEAYNDVCDERDDLRRKCSLTQPRRKRIMKIEEHINGFTEEKTYQIFTQGLNAFEIAEGFTKQYPELRAIILNKELVEGGVKINMLIMGLNLK